MPTEHCTAKHIEGGGCSRGEKPARARISATHAELEYPGA